MKSLLNAPGTIAGYQTRPDFRFKRFKTLFGVLVPFSLDRAAKCSARRCKTYRQVWSNIKIGEVLS